MLGLVEVWVGELGDSNEALGTVMGVAFGMEAVREQHGRSRELGESFLYEIDVRFINLVVEGWWATGRRISRQRGGTDRWRSGWGCGGG